MAKRLTTTLGMILLVITGGCGDTPPTTTTSNTAEGLWGGTINTNRTLTAAVLDDGTYYFFYSAPANPAVLSGVVQGSGTSSNGTFSSSNTKDFGSGFATLDATVSGSYTARQFLNGSILYAVGGTVTFSSSYNSAYDTTPTIASFAGVYQGQAGSSGGSQLATITVSGDGTFTGTEQNGCTFTGILTPRTRGNVLNQTVTFAGGACFFGNATFQGIVYRDLITNRLYAAAPNSTRTDAAIFFGIKIL
jgi:hypothetical protein